MKFVALSAARPIKCRAALVDHLDVSMPEKRDISELCNEIELLRGNSSGADFSRNIFLYWDSGIEEAPDLVRLAFLTAQNICPGYKVILISRKNIEQYFPGYSVFRSSLTLSLREAHIADFLRTYLICRYGGVWIDASCVVLQDLSVYAEKIVQKHGFYIPKSRSFSDRQIMNWFLASRPGCDAFCDLMAAWLQFACRPRATMLELTFQPQKYCRVDLIGPRTTDIRALHEIEQHGYFPYFFYHYLWNEVCRRQPLYQVALDMLPDKPPPVAKLDRRKFIGRTYFARSQEGLVFDPAAVAAEDLFPIAVRTTILTALGRS